MVANSAGAFGENAAQADHAGRRALTAHEPEDVVVADLDRDRRDLPALLAEHVDRGFDLGLAGVVKWIGNGYVVQPVVAFVALRSVVLVSPGQPRLTVLTPEPNVAP